MSASDNLSPQQFFHGTSARLQPGDYLSPKGANAYGRAEDESGRSHVYFTADKNQAWSYAYARGGSEPHVYQVEPTGKYEEDPLDLYDSARTRARLRVVRELGEHE